MKPDRYYYRKANRIIYLQPLGIDDLGAETVGWAGSCEEATKIVAELERLRKESIKTNQENLK
jgi:hypothetical protein